MAHQPYDPFYPLYHHQYHQDPYAIPEHKLGSKINTLFVSGLPDDVKPREIHNLFRRRPGFQSCQLKYTGRGNQVVAFATFINNQSAMAALHELNGVTFDPLTNSALHVELARSNSRRKSKPGDGPYVVIDRRSEGTANDGEVLSDNGESESEEPNRNDNQEPGDKDGLAAVKSETATDPENFVAAANELTERTAEEGLPPCSTLFIANLGPNCTAEELTGVLSLYPGFNGLKIRARGGMPVAFADFEEIEQAKKAIKELQGSTLASSDRGPMNIEFARCKMRKP